MWTLGLNHSVLFKLDTFLGCYQNESSKTFQHSSFECRLIHMVFETIFISNISITISALLILLASVKDLSFWESTLIIGMMFLDD